MVNAFRRMIFVIGLAVIIGSIMVTSVGGLRIEINSPSDGDIVSTDKITVYGRAIMDPSGAVVESVIVTVNDHPHPAYGTPSWHSELISLQSGQNKITAIAIDGSGKSNTTPIIYVNYEPTPTPTNESSPTPPPTTTTTSNGGYRPTLAPTPTPTGCISITTIPPGAEVYLDTSPKGTSPITLENVTEGRHKVKITKEGYRSEPREIYLWGDETTKLNIELKPLKGSIAVYSIPDEASVYLDNDYIKNKTTPCMLCEVVVGLHTIKLTKSDYFNVTGNVSVSVGRTSHLHKNLTGYGSINISSVPSGASVYLDDVDMDVTTSCMLSEVVVGPHAIKLNKSDYFNVTGNVSVSVGRTSHLHKNLTGYGSIAIISDPSDPEVYLDGNYTEVTSTNNIISKVVQGNHSIEFKKLGYVPVTKNIQVSAGETTSVRVRLNRTFPGILTDSGGVPLWAIIILTSAALLSIIRWIFGK